MDGIEQVAGEALEGKKPIKITVTPNEAAAFIEKQRVTIDASNEQAVAALRARVDAARRVAVAKWLAGEPNFNPSREQEIRGDARELGEKLGVRREDAEALVTLMLSIARREQDNLREKLER